VAADCWLEQGNRWGARVGARTTGFPDEDTLLRAAVECLGLEVQWRMGFARRAAIRPACVRGDLSPGAVLAALLTHPLSQFLEQLELDGLRLFDLRGEGEHRDAARSEFVSFLQQWLPPGVTSLEVGVSQLGIEGELERIAGPLAQVRPSLRQRYWLHGTTRIEPGGEVSPVFGGQVDCMGLVRCAFQELPNGTHALKVLGEVPVAIRSSAGELRRATWWFPGEELEVQGRVLRFTEHTQTLLVLPG
jgi:hypothetical protein